MSSFPAHWQRFFYALGLLSLGVLVIFPARGQAQSISSCSASVSPTSVVANTTATLGFTVTNGDSTAIQWVKIVSSSELFEILSASNSGWSASIDSPTEVTFRNGTISGGGSSTFNVSVQAGVTPTNNIAWTVTAAATSTGTDPVTCSGNPRVHITGNDTTAPVISNITVTNITTSAATVTWTTNEAATSVVEYGTTSAYGSTKSDSELVTSHSLTLTGLSADTTYHYRVKSVDAANNSATSSNNTFVTAKPAATPTPAVATPTPTPTVTIKPLPTATATATPRPRGFVSPSPTPLGAPTLPTLTSDITAPLITLAGIPDGPVATAPTLTGQASDDTSVVRVEYSTDGGANWLPVDALDQAGTPAVTFSFTPTLSEDGNFSIIARAFDPSTNEGRTEPAVIIIDRLPPQPGLSLMASGPQILTPSSEGVIASVAGVEQHLTLTAIGGPISIDIVVPTPGSTPQTFSLVRNQETGLWSGTLFITEPGTYQPEVHLRDGARNEVTSHLGTIVVQPRGRISGPGGERIHNATVTLYTRDPLTTAFRVWDGRPFRQTHPFLASADGTYGFMVPPGTYYLEVAAPGYTLLRTGIFSLVSTQPVATDVHVTSALHLKVGSWRLRLPGLIPTNTALAPPVLSQPELSFPLIGQELPPFTVTNEQAQAVASASWRGQPMIISFLTSWAPPAQEQLSALDEVLEQSGVAVIGILSHESPAAVATFRQRGRYTLPLMSDANGEALRALGAQTVPTHFFINRQGIVVGRSVGVLSSQELRQKVIY
jgi:peroxiredoxin